MGSKISDNEAFAEGGGMSVGGSAINTEFAPSAELFVKQQGAYSSYNEAARTVASGINNTIHESGSLSSGRDLISTGFMVGDSSTVNISAPEQMWGLLEQVVNVGAESQRQALAAYDRMTDSHFAVSVPEIAIASAAVQSESSFKPLAQLTGGEAPQLNKKALLIGGGALLLFLNRKKIGKAL